MAKQVITLLTDDLEGGEAETTIEFAVDGIAYSIDLNKKNADKLRDTLATYTGAGTRIGRVSTNGYSPGASLRPRANGVDHANFRANRQLNTEIREWAARNGYEISERGRIPQHVVNAFHRNIPNPGAQLPEPEPVAEPEPTPVKATKAAPAKKTTRARTTRATA